MFSPLERAARLWRARPDFSVRDQRLEMMEDPDLPRSDLDDALRELRRMNRVFGGVHMSRQAIARAVGGRTSFTMLDVGCGDGEIPRDVAKWAAAKGKGFDALGVDLTQASIDLARELTSPQWSIRYSKTDLFDLPEDQKWDIVHTSLVMHHLTEAQTDAAIAKMLRLARVAVIINDLHRAPVAWLGAALGARAVTRCHVVHADAPHSVARAFVREDLEAMARRSDASASELSWRFPYRWMLRLTP